LKIEKRQRFQQDRVVSAQEYLENFTDVGVWSALDPVANAQHFVSG
jgi:hypothetical protein